VSLEALICSLPKKVAGSGKESTRRFWLLSSVPLHAGGESGFEDEDFLFFVEAVLVAAAFGGFDDDLEKLVVGFGAGGAFGAFLGEGLELCGVGERGFRWLGGLAVFTHGAPA